MMDPNKIPERLEAVAKFLASPEKITESDESAIEDLVGDLHQLWNPLARTGASSAERPRPTHAIYLEAAVKLGQVIQLFRSGDRSKAAEVARSTADLFKH
jgi:hypothetical protein